ncbi:unnamed protein product [Linum tenue]|uniref:F-box domain-containing protein n=1 Tax=Linum tenue TaxID=586396 RepID=A0AAV0R4Q4_9ROSI|nr:unnamed protein product [Linum tenue]
MLSSSGTGGVGEDGCWYDIPIVLLCDIQSRLFVVDRCNFGHACKTWRSSLSSPTTFYNEHRLEKVLEIHRLPILVHIGNNSSEQVNFLDPITNSANTLPLPPGSIGTGAMVRCPNRTTGGCLYPKAVLVGKSSSSTLSPRKGSGCLT